MVNVTTGQTIGQILEDNNTQRNSFYLPASLYNRNLVAVLSWELHEFALLAMPDNGITSILSRNTEIANIWNLSLHLPVFTKYNGNTGRILMWETTCDVVRLKNFMIKRINFARIRRTSIKIISLSVKILCLVTSFTVSL